MLFLWEAKLTREPLASGGPDYRRTEGAVVDFYGVVRELEDDRLIEGIEYKAFESMAERLLAEIAQAAGEQHGVSRVILHHRIGFVPAGEPSLFLRVCAERRAAAFRASTEIVEKLKALVPIWKHPVYVAAQVT
jgi:molybdopterin synthase catalytic subunit